MSSRCPERPGDRGFRRTYSPPRRRSRLRWLALRPADQLRSKRGAQVVVGGTPGQPHERGRPRPVERAVSTRPMLRMGFAYGCGDVSRRAPRMILTALFSATMPAAIEKVARRHLKDPVRSRSPPSLDVVLRGGASKHKIGALARAGLRPAHQGRPEKADAPPSFRAHARRCRRRCLLGCRARILRRRHFGDVAQTERERMVERLKNVARRVGRDRRGRPRPMSSVFPRC